jgi:putative ABC transport system permease protein
VEEVDGFLRLREAYVNGTAAKTEAEACVGEILARLASIKLGDEVGIAVGGRALKIKVVGIFRALTQADAELIVPMNAANDFIGGAGEVSLVEFAIKSADVEDTLTKIEEVLPEDVQILRIQQLTEFVQDVNVQTLSFLNLWSSAVYVVVVAASYVVATRLIAEADYELAMLRTIGVKRRFVFKLVLTHTLIVAFFGSVLGLAVGLAGAQVVSTVVRWVWVHVEVMPFLAVEQVFLILLSAFASCLLGCIYPAFKSARRGYVEPSL